MKEEKKTHWRKHDKTDFLGAVDIDELGVKEIKLTIDHVAWKNVKVRGANKDCRIATFTDKKIKPMILNVTNSKAIKMVTKSTYLEDWKNIEVVIYIKDGVRMGSDITEALRIRSAKKVGNTPKNKKAITDKSFSLALEAVENNSYTAKQVTDQYILSESQIKQLNDVKN